MGLSPVMREESNLHYNKLVDQAIEYLKGLPDSDERNEKKDDATPHAFETEHVEDVAGLKIPKGEGAEQVKKILKLLKSYARNKSETKPISIAIFGPPGSGKSTFVRQISKNVDGIRLVKTANMTQVNHSEELAEAFKNALLSVRETTDIPMIFFDEFDAMRNGARLGWLSWFLAPMEDGVMLAQGQELEVGKAVFVFAGGTAETMDEFSRRAKQDHEAYRARKVPDFISRLRGAIDIGGINDHGENRVIRRALALSHCLGGPSAIALDQKNKLRKLLEQGHFVHGVRSLKTVLNAEKAPGGLNKMEPVIRRQHYSRGEFDGLTIGVSAGLDKQDGSQDLTVALSERLLQSGAAIAYAGSFLPQGTLEKIVETARNAPSSLFREKTPRPRIVNYLGYPASLKSKGGKKDVFEARKLDTISGEELKTLGAPTEEFFAAFSDDPKSYNPAYHAAWAISQFRLRVRVVQDISALVICGGKDNGKSWGRMSGIAEEVMIAVALGKPIYVLGGAGGAARAVGKLLGLHDAPAWLNTCLTPPKGAGLEKILNEHAADFKIPGVPASPTNLPETRDYLFNHGVSTKNWCRNGLSIEENRALFAMDLTDAANISDAVNLILKGLGAVDWNIA